MCHRGTPEALSVVSPITVGPKSGPLLSAIYKKPLYRPPRWVLKEFSLTVFCDCFQYSQFFLLILSNSFHNLSLTQITLSAKIQYTMKYFYHLFSCGADAADFIINEADYCATSNRIAVLAFVHGVIVLAFGIEDTHLHILIYATPEAATAFKANFQRETRCYIMYTREHHLDAQFTLTVGDIKDEIHLKRTAAYVVSQATKDGKKVMPYDYKWCSAALYFRTTPVDLLWRINPDLSLKQVVKLGNFNIQDRWAITRSKRDLPGDWLVCDGLILPSSFVDVKQYQHIYGTPNSFRVFLASTKESDKMVLNDMAEARGISLEEDESRYVCSGLCREMFGFADTRRLGTTQRIELARALRKQYHMGLPQIARRVHLPESELIKYVK